MDTCFVSKCVATHDRFVALDVEARDLAQQSTGRDQALGDDASGGVIHFAACSHGHDHFFERTVACPFTDSVDGAFDLTCTGLDGCQRIGDCHSQVIMAVAAQNSLVDVGDTVDQRLDSLVHFVGSRVADCIGDVDRGCTGPNRGLNDSA